MDGPKTEPKHPENGFVNSTFTNDEGRIATMELPRIPTKRPSYEEHARL